MWDKYGNVKTVEAIPQNASQFLLVDKSCNDLETHLSKFNLQVMNKYDFELFSVPAGKYEKFKEGLEELLLSRNNPQCKEMLQKFKVKTDAFKTKQQESSTCKTEKKQKKGRRL